MTPKSGSAGGYITIGAGPAGGYAIIVRAEFKETIRIIIVSEAKSRASKETTRGDTTSRTVGELSRVAFSVP